MRTLVILGVVGALTGLARGEETPTSKPTAGAKVYVGVFNMEGEGGEDIAEKVRIRLGKWEEYEVLDRFTMGEAAATLGAGADRGKLIEMMDARLGVQIAIYGTVSRQGATVTAEVVCVDRRDKGKPTEWSARFSDDTERAAPLIARQIVEKLRRQAEWTPPQAGDEPEPPGLAKEKPLNANGDFEKGDLGWEAFDNVATFLSEGPPGRGKVLGVRTDLARDLWLAYRKGLLAGQADPARPPPIARDTSYGSVAGLEGVHVRSEWLPATPGQRYWLTADCLGQGGAKVFVKGFVDWRERAEAISEGSLAKRGLTPEQFAALPAEKRKALLAEETREHPELYRREVYRWYLNGKDAKGAWTHMAGVFPPRGGLPANVQWLQIQIYSYWPPGVYLWDNVWLYKDPRQKAPSPEEVPRTPNLGKERP
ncbi:MAG: hypothetical protein WCK05_00075 [Planctomycetota bacterium]